MCSIKIGEDAASPGLRGRPGVRPGDRGRIGPFACKSRAPPGKSGKVGLVDKMAHPRKKAIILASARDNSGSPPRSRIAPVADKVGDGADPGWPCLVVSCGVTNIGRVGKSRSSESPPDGGSSRRDDPDGQPPRAKRTQSRADTASRNKPNVLRGSVAKRTQFPPELPQLLDVPSPISGEPARRRRSMPPAKRTQSLAPFRPTPWSSRKFWEAESRPWWPSHPSQPGRKAPLRNEPKFPQGRRVRNEPNW